MNPSYDQYRAVRTFGSLDGLRAISIVMVVWHHAAHNAYPGIQFLHLGHLGVHFFFVISGFLITTLLLREREKYGTISLKNFYIRRSLRIFPLYYAVILLYIGLVYFVERGSPYGTAFFGNLKYYLTYTSNWFVALDQPRVIFYYAWSLATEEQFYLMWPSVERYLKGYWPIVAALALIAINLIAATGIASLFMPQDGLVIRVMLNIAIPICLGVLLAHWYHSPSGYRIASRLLGWRWSSAAMMAVLLGVMLLPLKLTVWFYLAIYLAMAAVVASCVIREDHALARFLSLPPVRLIGVLSYGMYLLHMLSLNAVRRVLERAGLEHPVVLFLIALPLTIFVAWLSYRFFESFFLNLKQRFSRAA